MIRGLGYARSVEDLENAVIKSNDHVPVYIRNVAQVAAGPALRRGALDKGGAEAVGGVVVASYLDQSFRRSRTTTQHEIREATVQAGLRRIRPCLMTTATTILALIPVLTSTGRGSDVMVPMAIPSFGGMTIELMTLFFVPVGYCPIQEIRLKIGLGPVDPEGENAAETS